MFLWIILWNENVEAYMPLLWSLYRPRYILFRYPLLLWMSKKLKSQLFKSSIIIYNINLLHRCSLNRTYKMPKNSMMVCYYNAAQKNCTTHGANTLFCFHGVHVFAPDGKGYDDVTIKAAWNAYLDSNNYCRFQASCRSKIAGDGKCKKRHPGDPRPHSDSEWCTSEILKNFKFSDI